MIRNESDASSVWHFAPVQAPARGKNIKSIRCRCCLCFHHGLVVRCNVASYCTAARDRDDTKKNRDDGWQSNVTATSKRIAEQIWLEMNKCNRSTEGLESGNMVSSRDDVHQRLVQMVVMELEATDCGYASLLRNITLPANMLRCIHRFLLSQPRFVLLSTCASPSKCPQVFCG